MSGDPVGGLGVVRALELPLGQHLAVHGFVPLVRARKTKLKRRKTS